jgi:hypothetical protein
MLLTEHGLHFEREGQHWRCQEHARLRMNSTGGFEIDGDRRHFASLSEALAALGLARFAERRAAER